MTDTIQILDRVEVDVRRPNGQVETVDVTAKYWGLNDKLFARMVAETRKAGRGEVLTYRNIMKTVEAPKPSAADLAEMDHIRHQNTVYRMAAGGEPCDRIGGANDIDRTPSHKEDY